MSEEPKSDITPQDITRLIEQSPLEDTLSKAGTLERFIVAILAVTLAATCFLISAGHGVKQGYQAWRSDSVLRILVELLNFNYQYPTLRGVEIKWLAQGLGAAAIILAVTLAWFSRSRRDEGEQDIASEDAIPPATHVEKRSWMLTPPAAAALALAGFAGWSILSYYWSVWPEASFLNGLQLSFAVLWAIVLSRTLTRTSVHWASLAIVLILAATATLGLWYRQERSPEMRLEFPIGNPLFFAACLLPGIALLPAVILRRWSTRDLASQRWYGPKSRQPSSSITKWRWIILLAATLIPLLWAFRLAEPRGPALGLIAGINVAILLAVRRRWRWAVVLAIVLQIFAAYGLYQAHMARPGGDRNATIRLRLCTWRYAGTLALHQPLVGHGRDTYPILAQRMSVPDVERDPLAFPSLYLGHAHNEWLQVLAELGAVGFALIATALGITFWCVLLTLHRPMTRADKWCLLGLTATLTAIIVEECFNVAMRKPGLPIFFYTVIGLLLAFCRDSLVPSLVVPRKHGQPLRWVVLLAGLFVVWAIASASWQDWQGALAHTQAVDKAEQENWNQAFRHFETASSDRFCIEDRLAAFQGKVFTAYRAAEWQVQRTGQMLARQKAMQGINPQARMLAAEQSAAFETYFRLCQKAGIEVLQRAPGWPDIARRLGESWILKAQMERIEQQFGLREEVANYIAEARPWLLAEYEDNRLNWAAAYRLLMVIPDQPMLDRLNIARTPLRYGPMPAEMEGLLATYANEPHYNQIMDQALAEAHHLLKSSNSQAWSNAYIPELFRLAALARKLEGRFADAARLAEEAATLLDTIRARFPLTALYARHDQCRYLFFDNPTEPLKAIELCRKLIEDWPASPQRETQLQPIRHDLGLFLLATGQEDEVRNLLARSNATTMPITEGHDPWLADLYVQLCQTFSSWPIAYRPAEFGFWLARAFELDPRSAHAHLLAIAFALERGENVSAIQYLNALQDILVDPVRMEMALRALLARLPDDPTLRNYVLQWQQDMTRPSVPGELNDPEK
ncbi:MAG: O-antigen ligase family protein [Phycisphaerales bacterium]|nr:O-antigen ligase family protein [Phycisphaerales bacterium]